MGPRDARKSAAFVDHATMSAPKPDVITGELFWVEETFTEWQNSDWATGGGQSPMDEPVTCQDCHMSSYPKACQVSAPSCRSAARQEHQSGNMPITTLQRSRSP